LGTRFAAAAESKYRAGMTRVACCSLVVALAGCPPQQAPQPPQEPQLQNGCPSANGVFLASYATQEPGKGRTGWVMPLYVPAGGGSAGSDLADYTAIDDAAAKAAGVPDVQAGNLWLVSGNVAPCLIKLGSHYLANIDGHAAYGIELDGCPAPSDPQTATGLVLASQDTPTGCQFQSPQSAGARLGQMTGPKTWQAPTQEKPIPPEIATLVPPHDCTAPGCEKLWGVGEIKVGDKPVAWAAAVNWLTVGDPANTCDWKAERWSGFFVAGADGSPVQVTEGLTHPLALSTMLLDQKGPRVLLAEGPGEYATYDLSPTGAKLGHHITWGTASDDDWAAIDHLGPQCEPDAKPQSPYP
jgi:hypothetical protein